MKIRTYKDNDFSKLEEILHKTKLYYKPLDKREILKKQIEYYSESILVAEEDKKIVGGVFILYQPFFSFIWHLCVDPDYQNQGIGTKLMNKAEKVLKQKGNRLIGIYVEEDNKKVIEFYKRRGWYIFPGTIPMGKKF